MNERARRRGYGRIGGRYRVRGPRSRPGSTSSVTSDRRTAVPPQERYGRRELVLPSVWIVLRRQYCDVRRMPQHSVTPLLMFDQANTRLESVSGGVRVPGKTSERLNLSLVSFHPPPKSTSDKKLREIDALQSVPDGWVRVLLMPVDGRPYLSRERDTGVLALFSLRKPH